MDIEIRADGMHVSGYANVTEKKSRPVITPRGKVVEEIEPRAFQKALDRAANVTMTKDHNPGSVIAETRAGNLELYEDNIGLHYDAVVSDEQTILETRAGKIKGLSFGMYNIKDTLEERANDLPLRKITALDLDHITLVVNKQPAYSATSIEMRANDEISEMEFRAIEDIPRITDTKPKEVSKPSYDNTAYRDRIEKIKEIKKD